MVLNETHKKWLGAVGAILFLGSQAAFFLAGLTGEETRQKPVAVIIVSDECMEYVRQSPIQRLPDDVCIRELKYLKYRIQIVLEEVSRVP